MAVEQMNISLSPRMARFIRGKVRAGGYTNISEVVRAAVRRMQEEESREASLARSAVDEILDQLTASDRSSVRDRVRAGFSAIERGEYTGYIGREGLRRLATGVKSRGRKLITDRAPKA